MQHFPGLFCGQSTLEHNLPFVLNTHTQVENLSVSLSRNVLGISRKTLFFQLPMPSVVNTQTTTSTHSWISHFTDTPALSWIGFGINRDAAAGMEEEEEEGTEGFMKILKCQLATVSKRLHSSEKSLHTAANE